MPPLFGTKKHDQITDYSLACGNVEKTRIKVGIFPSSLNLRQYLVPRVCGEKLDFNLSWTWKVEMSTMMFNLNTCSTETCFRDFAFKKDEITRIATLCG